MRGMRTEVGTCMVVLLCLATGCRCTNTRYKIVLSDVLDQQELNQLEEILAAYGKDLGCTSIGRRHPAYGGKYITCWKPRGRRALRHGRQWGSKDAFFVAYHCDTHVTTISNLRYNITPFLESVKTDLVREFSAVIRPEAIEVSLERVRRPCLDL